MTLYQPERVLKVGAELGEHPVWRVEDQRLYWLDIERATINRFDPSDGRNETWRLVAEPGCFAFRPDGTAVIAARDGIYSIDFETGRQTMLAKAVHDPVELRFNDGRTDRQGRFWASTFGGPIDAGVLPGKGWYRHDGFGLEFMLPAGGVTNGTAFSPDGRTMYRAETMSRTIFALDYDEASGTPSNERIFAVVPSELGGPDGATMDTDGGYWVALAAPQDGSAETGGVARFDRNGRLDRYVRLPVPMVTMVAFGGPKLSVLYVTTARLERFMKGTIPEGAGDIYAFETDRTGELEMPIMVL